MSDLVGASRSSGGGCKLPGLEDVEGIDVEGFIEVLRVEWMITDREWVR